MYLKLSQSEIETLLEISSALGVDPGWLYSLIDFESKWDPLARNPISSARGLIQFTDTTTKRMFGFADADNLVAEYPDRISQLRGPVYKYLSVYAPYPTQQSLTMAVFYPAYRNVPPDTVFPDTVLNNNPGIRTPLDYMKKVFGMSAGLQLAIVGGIAAIVFVFYSLSQKG